MPGIDYGMEAKFENTFMQQLEANYNNKCRKTSKYPGLYLILVKHCILDLPPHNSLPVVNPWKTFAS